MEQLFLNEKLWTFWGGTESQLARLIYYRLKIIWSRSFKMNTLSGVIVAVSSGSYLS